MKILKKLFLFLAGLSLITGFVFLTEDLRADKVYSTGSGVTAKTFNARGFVSRIQNPAFGDSLAMGLVTEGEGVLVYGENPNVSDATTDIWGGSSPHFYSPDSSADILSIASSSASDFLPITIVGLDASGDSLTQTVNLNGQTRVAITGLWRVLDTENDSSSDAVGNIIVYAGNGTVPTLGDIVIRAVILAGNHKALMALHTIPNDKVGFLVKHGTGISLEDGTGNLESLLYVRKFGKDFQIKSRVNVATPNNSTYQESKTIPIVIPGKSDIRYSVADSSTDSSSAWGSFELMIFDEGMFDTDFLTSIDQP